MTALKRAWQELLTFFPCRTCRYRCSTCISEFDLVSTAMFCTLYYRMMIFAHRRAAHHAPTVITAGQGLCANKDKHVRKACNNLEGGTLRPQRTWRMDSRARRLAASTLASPCSPCSRRSCAQTTQSDPAHPARRAKPVATIGTMHTDCDLQPQLAAPHHTGVL